jgi:sec-independent protein translocase protein TatB
MFGMSFYEIAIIAIVALLILGPEKLPEVARTAGKFLRQAREMSTAFRDTIMMEADLHEKKQQKKKSSSTSSALVSATAASASTASTGHIGAFDMDEDYEGPLDQLHDDYFHLHPPDDVYTNREDVELELHQMSDPFNTTEVELPEQLAEHASPDEDMLAAHLASPFDAHLVERREIDLTASRQPGAHV